MPVLVLRHEPFEHLGYFATILEAQGVPFRYRDLGDALPPGSFQGVIIMGGPMSANDPLPGLADELRMIEQAVKAQIPLLGICLGAQLIARALGARVFRNAQSEIGWAPVWLTDAGLADPLLGGMGSPRQVFHWHGETFELPAGADCLAYSERCRHQAFRYAADVYGIQFHPEITPEMIEDWSGQPANCADVAALGTRVDARAHETRSLARAVLEPWIGRLSVRETGFR